MTSDPNPDEFLYDRRALGNVLAPEVFNVFIAKSRIDKLASLGLGPPIDGRLGPKELTTRRNGIEYLRQLLSPDAKSKPSLTAELLAKRDRRRAADRDHASA
jgi:hypothetical protein